MLVFVIFLTWRLKWKNEDTQMFMKKESNQNTLSNFSIYCQLRPRCGLNNISRHTDFKRFLFDLKCFSLSLYISIQYFQSERTSELSQSLRAVKCNSQEIIITRKKKGYWRAVFPYLERAKYEKEINGFLVENYSLWVDSCVHTRLCRITWSWGEGRREDGHEGLEGSVT